MGVDDFRKQMRDKGWFLFEGVVSIELIERMRIDLEKCYVRCREIQIKNGLENTECTVHHIIGQELSFLDCLAGYERLDEYFTAYFGGKYILNSFGGNILSKGMSYANDIHRDIRSFSGTLPLMLNTLVMLDDFTRDNGATWLMERGHRLNDKPDESEFNESSFQITGKAGSVAVWNSNLWHRAGVNKTDKPRCSITPELSRPFFKQGYDYTKFAEDYMPDYLKQVLGYYSRTPTSLDDWYRKSYERFYRADQG